MGSEMCIRDRASDNKQVTFVLKSELATNRNFDFIVATSLALPVNSPSDRDMNRAVNNQMGTYNRLAVVPGSPAIRR